MEKVEYSRRGFIEKCMSVGAMFLGGTALLTACGMHGSGKKEGSVTVDPCDDFSDVSASELEKRKKFGYMNESTVPGSHCGNCSLFIPGKSEDDCGGCLLFKGPVHPTGYCTQYAAKT